MHFRNTQVISLPVIMGLATVPKYQDQLINLYMVIILKQYFLKIYFNYFSYRISGVN